MHYRIFYSMFTLFCSWGWTSGQSGQSVSSPDCSSRLHYCMVENGYRAANCKNGPVSVPSDVVTSNRSLWSVVPKGFPLCGQFGHRIVELDQSVRSKIQSLQLKSDGVATFICPTKDSCYWRLTVVHVVPMPQLLNVSLVYHGNQFLGERGNLTCTIDWARNDTSVRKTWFRTREQTMGTSQISRGGYEKYTLLFDSLKQRDAKEYQCGAIGLAFGALPFRFSAAVVIDLRMQDLRSIHATTSTPLSPSLESSKIGSTKNGTWTITETTNSIMTVPSFSNLLSTSSIQSLALQRTPTPEPYSSYESPSTLGSSLSPKVLSSSPKPESCTSHSQSKTFKSQLRSTKYIPKASKSHNVPTKVRPILSVTSASRRLLSSLFFWQLFVSRSLVLCCIE